MSNSQRIKQLVEKQEKRDKQRSKQRIARYAAKYNIKKRSEQYDEVMKRYSYAQNCIDCKTEFRAYGQDLHQANGRCDTCRKKKRNETRKAKRKAEKDALTQAQA